MYTLSVHIKVNHLIQYGRHRRHFLLANIRFFTQEPHRIYANTNKMANEYCVYKTYKNTIEPIAYTNLGIHKLYYIVILKLSNFKIHSHYEEEGKKPKLLPMKYENLTTLVFFWLKFDSPN